MGYPHLPVRERFNNAYMPVTESGCWIWMLSLNADGYGSLCIDKMFKRAHRLSWELHKGEIPIGMSVLHKCDIPACVNPDHLFLGTQSDNMKDMYAKERHPRYKNINPKKRRGIPALAKVKP